MTILGEHSVAELSDWVKAIDYQLGQIGDASVAAAPAWRSADAAGFNDWLADWGALQKRYAGPRADALDAINASHFPLPDNLVGAEDQWQAIAHALEKTPGGPQSKGDLQELYTRLAGAQKAPVDFSQNPQPRPGTDADLGTYQAADTTIKAGQAVVAAIPSMPLSTKILIGGGLLATVVVLLKIR